MIINIKSTSTELTPAISSYIQEKIGSLEKFLSAESSENILVNVEIGLTTKHHNSGKIFKAEVNISVSGKFIRAVSDGEDLYAAIDAMRDIAMREITNHNKKDRDLFRRGKAKIKNFLRGFNREK